MSDQNTLAMHHNQTVQRTLSAAKTALIGVAALIEFAAHLIVSGIVVTLFGFYTVLTGLGLHQWATDAATHSLNEYAGLVLIFFIAVGTLIYFSYFSYNGITNTVIGRELATHITN